MLIVAAKIVIQDVIVSKKLQAPEWTAAQSTLVLAVCSTLLPDASQFCGTWALSNQGRSVRVLLDAIGLRLQRLLFLCGLPCRQRTFVSVVFPVLQREISELGSSSEGSTVVDAMWGAGSEESAERLEMACEPRIITSTRTINP